MCQIACGGLRDRVRVAEHALAPREHLRPVLLRLHVLLLFVHALGQDALGAQCVRVLDAQHTPLRRERLGCERLRLCIPALARHALRHLADYAYRRRVLPAGRAHAYLQHFAQ